MIWILALLWVFLNIFDIVVSGLAAQTGAVEVGALYSIIGDFWIASILKMVLMLGVLGILLWIRKGKWLVWLNSGMLILIMWNVFVLRQQI